MKSKEKYLLVASFLEGKNFPRRAKTQFIIEAKFDGEQLTTDAIDHNDNLEINQELAWELDKKTLQAHKLQRSVIKCNCYAVQLSDLKKENVGYFVLDVRSAPENVGKPKVYTLLQTKYSKLKPEIKVNLYVESDSVSNSVDATAANKENIENLRGSQENFKIRDPKIVLVDSKTSNYSDISKKFKPILNDSEGYFQIGPDNPYAETYVLSITILFAKNLMKLLPNDLKLNTNGSFFFSYTLINNRIITESFSDILTSQINAERATVRLHTTFEILKAFLLTHPAIEIYFCGDDRILAKTHLNINTLMKTNDNSKIDINKEPILIDELLKFEQINPSYNDFKLGATNLDTIIGVQLSLRKEEDEAALFTNDNQNETRQENHDENNGAQQHEYLQENNHQNRANIVEVEEETETHQHHTERVSVTPSPNPVQQQYQQHHAKPSKIESNVHDDDSTMGNVHFLNEEMQLRAAYEIQLWKEVKEKEFEQYLKELEARKLKELADAFKQRDKEREMIVQKKVKEYTDLETKLKTTLNELEKRERLLTNSEMQISRYRADLQREYEVKLNELREASKRVQEQAEHHISLQKLKCETLEEEINRLKKQLQDYDKRYADKEAEFMRYKEKENSKPEFRLQSELNMLNIEKIGIERKLEQAVKSKNHYKEQWINALQEISALKKHEEEKSRQNVKKQEIELNHLRMRYLANEENALIKKDEKQIETLKNELHKLKKNVASSVTSSNEDIKSSLDDVDASLEEHIARLIEERDTLLKTGVYTNKDSIIMELDRKIRDSMNQIRK